MRTSLSVLAGLAIAGSALSPLFAAEGKPAAKEVKKVAPAKKADPQVKYTGFAADLDQLATALELTDEQKTKLQAMKEVCAQDLSKYDRDNVDKLAAAQAKLNKANAANDGNAANAAKGTMDSVKAGREAVQAANDKKLFALLTPAQRAKWNTPILKNEMEKEFSMAFLGPKQLDRIAAFCAAQGKSLPQPLDAAKLGKSLDGLKRQVFETILTSKEKSDYLKSKTPQPVDKQGHGH
jgi:Spy/CpxP family protein refolding chaperone